MQVSTAQWSHEHYLARLASPLACGKRLESSSKSQSSCYQNDVHIRHVKQSVEHGVTMNLEALIPSHQNVLSFSYTEPRCIHHVS
jgi:hypothetical protein